MKFGDLCKLLQIDVGQKVSGQPAGDGVHEDQVWQTPVGVESRRFLKLNISR